MAGGLGAIVGEHDLKHAGGAPGPAHASPSTATPRLNGQR